MSDWQKHRAFASDMTTHGNWRGNCPFCGGRNTFTANIDTGTLKYNCYKLGCDVGGIFDTDMTAAEIRRYLNPAQDAEDVKEYPTMELPAYVTQPSTEHVKFNRFIKRWGLPARSLLYDVKDERVVFPIKYNGRIVDANGRSVGHKQPKWYRYTGVADYYTVGEGNTLLVVEDCISAMVANLEFPHITAMALLGTSLTNAHKAKISEYERIVVALDADAITKTLAFKREIEAWTGLPTIALKTQDDIKYRVTDDMDKLKDVLS